MNDVRETINTMLVKTFHEILELEEKAIITDEFSDISNNDMSLKMTVSSNAEKDDTIVTPEIPTGAADITDLFVSAIKTKNN